MKKKHGKLIMLVILAAFCLAACGRADIETVGGNEMAERLPEKAELFLKEYDFSVEGEYSFGSGIRINTLDGLGSEIPSEELMIPVFCGDELIGLLLSGETDELVTEETALRLFGPGTDRMYDVVRIGGGVFRIGPDGAELITGDAPEMTEQELKTMEAIRSSVTEENRMGKEKTVFRTIQPAPVTLYDPETGKTYSSSRIVIKFTEGNEEEKVLLFEEFCGGKLHGIVRAARRYTFTFGAKQNIKQLKALLRKALELDYVAEAMLEEARGMH